MIAPTYFSFWKLAVFKSEDWQTSLQRIICSHISTSTCACPNFLIRQHWWPRILISSLSLLSLLFILTVVKLGKQVFCGWWIGIARFARHPVSWRTDIQRLKEVNSLLILIDVDFVVEMRKTCKRMCVRRLKAILCQWNAKIVGKLSDWR